MTGRSSEGKWQVRIVRPGMIGLNRLPELLGLPQLARLPGMGQLVRPADVGEGLRAAMLDRENMLEDVNYQKVVPNRFVIEVSAEDYWRQFQPIERQVIEQWREQLLNDLITANSRQGRKEFRLGGRLQIEVRPSPSLEDTEARILSRIESKQSLESPPVSSHPSVYLPDPKAGAGSDAETPARPLATGQDVYLELIPTGQRWALYPGINTIGRRELNQIFLDLPEVQQRRLVSGQHAYIVMDQAEYYIYDGAPDGKPSANGTYVNLQRTPRQGYRLRDGDIIILAALDPLHPRSDTPGVVTFQFKISQKD